MKLTLRYMIMDRLYRYSCSRLLPVIGMILIGVAFASAHSSWREHANDMYEVFGFKENDEITAWMKHISSDLIDGYNKEKIFTVAGQNVGFYDYLKSKYPEFKCKHRVLFHWGYNSRPWNDQLQQKVDSYKWSDTKIKAFQQEIINEQRRRNRAANAYTEELFGFSSTGKEASKARALISIAYDVHILGDYTPDNKDLDGLCTLQSAVGDIINNIRELDKVNTKTLVAKIQKASRTEAPDPEKAAAILTILKKDLRKLLRTLPDSRISSLILTTDYQ